MCSPESKIFDFVTYHREACRCSIATDSAFQEAYPVSTKKSIAQHSIAQNTSAQAQRGDRSDNFRNNLSPSSPMKLHQGLNIVVSTEWRLQQVEGYMSFEDRHNLDNHQPEELVSLCLSPFYHAN